MREESRHRADARRVAYFVNQYPKVSHSFIRREILALERLGFAVERIALRGFEAALPDEEDRRELARTRYLLKQGLAGLLPALLATLLAAPLRLAAATRLALRMARQSQRGLPYHLVYVAEAARLARWTRASRVERIHAHFGTNSAEVVMLARVLGAPPYSFTVHGPEEFQRPMGLEEKIGRSEFVAAISSFGRSQLYCRARYPDWPKIRVVHCGIDASFWETPAAVPEDYAPRRLVCVGRLCAAKGQVLLLEAAAQLAARRVPFELVLAGDGPLRGELERLIARDDLAAHVHITGWLSGPDVRAQILASRALVLPSFEEGLPVALMEAMALRRPVLTTCIAGIPELVQHGVHGWLIPAGSVDELREAMARCLALPAEELQRLGEAARARVRARHSIDAQAAQLAELFGAAALHREALPGSRRACS